MYPALGPEDLDGITAEVFIETGTCWGAGVAAVAHLFKECHTIEFVQDHYEQSIARIAGRGITNITCHLGTSPDVLPLVINPEKKTCFFLDAHYRSLGRFEECPVYGECPLMAELAVIQGTPWKELPVIVIDDAVSFDGSNPGLKQWYNEAHWPSLDQIRAALPGHDVVVRLERIYCTPKGG